MKPLLALFCFLINFQNLSAQSPDYISIRKKNDRVIKNFYTGSNILFQTTDGSYLQGPVKAIRNDSLFILIYDVRPYRTMFGSVIKDTISVQTIGVHRKEIKRIHLSKKEGFFQRNTGPLLMIGGAGYFALNVLNGAIFELPITDKKNLRTLGIAAGAFGLGYLITKLFSSDGFSKGKHRIVYVDL